MLQKDSLFPWLTILDNCLLGLEIKGIKTEDNISYVNHLLDSYGLTEFKDKYPSSLSGGMRQKSCSHQDTSDSSGYIIIR